MVLNLSITVTLIWCFLCHITLQMSSPTGALKSFWFVSIRLLEKDVLPKWNGFSLSHMKRLSQGVGYFSDKTRLKLWKLWWQKPCYFRVLLRQWSSQKTLETNNLFIMFTAIMIQNTLVRIQQNKTSSILDNDWLQFAKSVLIHFCSENYHYFIHLTYKCL